MFFVLMRCLRNVSGVDSFQTCSSLFVCDNSIKIGRFVQMVRKCHWRLDVSLFPYRWLFSELLCFSWYPDHGPYSVFVVKFLVLGTLPWVMYKSWQTGYGCRKWACFELSLGILLSHNTRKKGVRKNKTTIFLFSLPQALNTPNTLFAALSLVVHKQEADLLSEKLSLNNAL